MDNKTRSFFSSNLFIFIISMVVGIICYRLAIFDRMKAHHAITAFHRESFHHKRLSDALNFRREINNEEKSLYNQ